MSLLSSLSAAVNQPFVQPVVWSEIGDHPVEKDHPIRDIIQFLRLWPTQEAQKLHAEFTRIGKLAAPDNDWIGETYYWVIALSLATSTGKGLLDSEWPRIFNAGVIAEKGIDPESIVDSGVPIDYKAIGVYLKAQFDGPAGLRLLAPVWGQAMELNGWAAKKEAVDAKKPVSTENSTSA